MNREYSLKKREQKPTNNTNREGLLLQSKEARKRARERIDHFYIFG